jgi:hypothetical protein
MPPLGVMNCQWYLMAKILSLLKGKMAGLYQMRNSPARNVRWPLGRSSGEELPAEAGANPRSNHGQDGKQFLIVWDVGLVYVREHRSNVCTIEQILFKHSRVRWPLVLGRNVTDWRCPAKYTGKSLTCHYVKINCPRFSWKQVEANPK